MSSPPLPPHPELPTDPALAGWLDYLANRLDCLYVQLEGLQRQVRETPEQSAVVLIGELRREVNEGLARALLYGRQSAPCSLCRGAGCSYACKPFANP